MGSKTIKQKEKSSANPDDDIFIKPLMKSRNEELRDRYRQRANPIPSDLQFMAHRMSDVHEYDHQQTGDKPTVSSDELKKENSYYNKQQGRSIRWH